MADAYLTLADWAKRVKPGGGIDEIIEVIATSNPIFNDAPVLEGNLPTGHQSTQRTTLPVGEDRLLNGGIASEKSTTEQIVDTCCMHEGLSQIDVAEAKLNGNEAAFRASEDNAFMAGLTERMALRLFYGNQKLHPEQMHGLTPRFNSIGTRVISAGGSGSDNTSIWIITWGPQTVHLIFPKGSTAGLSSEDLGRQLVDDGSSPAKRFLAYVTHFKWHLGLTIRNPNYVCRICNIDISDLTADAATGADLLDKMVKAYYTRPTASLGNMARTFVYCNSTIAEFLHKQSMNKANVNLTVDKAGGEPIVNFLGAPIHVCDAIAIDEAVVS